MEAWNFKKLGNVAETALNNGKKTHYFYPNQINLKISVKSKEQWIWSKKKKKSPSFRLPRGNKKQSNGTSRKIDVQ